MAPILALEDLCVSYAVASGPFGRRRPTRILEGVNLEIAPGEAVGLVGESGSGKSTLARAALRLVPIDAGTICYGGVDVTRLSKRDMRRHRRHVQMVFQDPYSSLDPGMTVEQLVAEPLEIHRLVSRSERRSAVLELLRWVGLEEEHLDRYPYEFSGGQRQRLAIARALGPRPRLVVCDEAVSALDVSTQNQIILLLRELRERMGIGYLFIAHDLGVVRQLTDRTVVMYCGQIVEEGPSDQVFEDPSHPYTKALLAALPVASVKRQRQRDRAILHGDVPNPLSPPSGCRFHERCDQATDECALVEPPWVSVGIGVSARCHLLTPNGAAAERASTPAV